ncbi:hypothetical protein [Amnibacterium setariae]|uniref:hypothetical protein n=1 Tax=Amnibacterium setariae TaxID=2306585 RepID=UPI0011C387C1|nr:hypothetical protein [Amnibacterium setariae]
MSTSATDFGLRNSSSRFRVALVDGHEVIASALRAAMRLAPEIDFVTWAQTVEGLLGRATAPLDLVLLDLRLRDHTSPELNVRRLTEGGIAFSSTRAARVDSCCEALPVRPLSESCARASRCRGWSRRSSRRLAAARS